MTPDQFGILLNKCHKKLDRNGALLSKQQGQIKFLANMSSEHSQKLNEHNQKLDEHGQKLDEHSQKLDEHGQKLDEHGQKLDIVIQRLDGHDRKFDTVIKRLDGHDRQFDLLISKVMDNSDRLDRIEETMATKEDIRGIHDVLDTIVGLVNKTNQEVTMLVHAGMRRDEAIEALQKDVGIMKPLLGLK